MRKIILMNGKKRSGKDFVSDIFVDRFNFTKFSIAKSLKDVACKIAGISYDEMEDLKNDEKSFMITYTDFEFRFKEQLRIMMTNYDSSKELSIKIDKFDIQTLDIFISGTGYGPPEIDARRFLQNMNVFKIIFDDDDIWINQTIREISKYRGDVVIADFRFPNEYEAVDKVFDNTLSIKVIGKNLYDKDEYDNHSSETSLDDWEFDYHINNTFWHSGSLFWQVTGLIQTLDINEGKS